MSKQVKQLITESYRRRFRDVDGAVLVDIRGMKSNDVNKLRGDLSKHRIRVTVVKNSLVRRAVTGTALQRLSELVEGPTSVVYGGSSVVNVARELLALAKQLESLKLKGALMEGELFGPEQVERLSKYPTREEAQSQVVTLMLSPARRVVGQVVGPGRKVASLVEAIKQKLEKGEAIQAVAAA